MTASATVSAWPPAVKYAEFASRSVALASVASSMMRSAMSCAVLSGAMSVFVSRGSIAGEHGRRSARSQTWSSVGAENWGFIGKSFSRRLQQRAGIEDERDVAIAENRAAGDAGEILH